MPPMQGMGPGNWATQHLHHTFKLTLFSEDAGGYLQSAGVETNELKVYKVQDDMLPANFERCVFRVKLVNSDGPPSLSGDNDPVPVSYGDRVQLHHTYSDRYLCVSRRMQCEHQRNCFQVRLLAASDITDEKDSLFLIRPRYKLRHEGEKVHLGDQAVFMTIGADSRYLHLSKTATPDVLQANCSFTATAWTLHLYDDMRAGPAAIRLGEPVVLFHKELEAYLASTAENQDSVSALDEQLLVWKARICTKEGQVISRAATMKLPFTSVLFAQRDAGPDGRASSVLLSDIYDDFKAEAVHSDSEGSESVNVRKASKKSSAKIVKSFSMTRSDKSDTAFGQRVQSSVALTNKLRHSQRQHSQGRQGSSVGHHFSFWEKPSLRSFCHSHESFASLTEAIQKKLHEFVTPFKEPEGPRTSTGVFLLNPPTDSKSRCISHWARGPSNALWMFENENPTVGGPVEFNEPYRLKHIASNRYLVIQEAAKLRPQPAVCEVTEENPDTEVVFIMSPDPLNEASLFIMHPVDLTGSLMVTSKTFFRVEHMQLGAFFHFPPPRLDESSTSGQRGSQPKDRKISSALTLSDQPYYEDVFLVYRPDTSQLAELNFVACSIATAQNYIQCCLRQEWDAVQQLVPRLYTALSKLILFCTESDDPDPLTRRGPPIRHHQQLLLDQHCHHVAIQVAKASESHSNTVVSLLCFRLLKQMVTGSPALAMSLSQYIPFMQMQLGDKLLVAETLLEIFKDNRPLLEELNEDVLTCFVQLCTARRKQAQYLNFLCELCVCHGTPITKNQDIICRQLVQNYAAIVLPMRYDPHNGKVMIMLPASFLFPTTENLNFKNVVTEGMKKPMSFMKAAARKVLAQNRAIQMFVSAPNAKWAGTSHGFQCDTWYTLRDFYRNAPASVTSYFELTMHLFSQLCYGGNTQTQNFVKSFLPESTLLAVLVPRDKDDELPDSCRSKFISIATEVYIQHVNPYGDMEFRATVKSWEDLSTAMQFGATNFVPEDNMSRFVQQLKDFSIQFLRQHAGDGYGTPRCQKVTNSLLQMWQKVISTSQFTLQELESLCPLLWDLLNSHISSSDSPKTSSPTLPHAWRVMHGRLGANERDRDNHSERSFLNRDWLHSSFLAREPSSVFLGREPSYFEGSVQDDGSIVVECKLHICRIVSLLLDRYYEVLFHNILVQFRAELIQRALHGENPSCSMVMTDMLDSISQYKALASPGTPEPSNEPPSPRSSMQPTQDPAMQTIADNWLLMRRLLNSNRLVADLLKLTLHDHPTLVSSALTLVVRLFSTRWEVHHLLLDARILFDSASQTTYQILCQETAVFKQLVIRHLSSAQSQQVEDLLCYFTALLDVQEQSTMSREPSVDDPTRPSHMAWAPTTTQDRIAEHQDMMRSTGLHLLVLDLLRRYSWKGSDPPDWPLGRLGYLFLQRFCAGHPVNQEALNESGALGLFLHHLPLNVGSDRCIDAMFSENCGLVVTVPVEVINEMVHHIGTGAPGWEEHVTFLKRLVMIRGMPVARNQVLVMKALVAAQAVLVEGHHPLNGSAPQDVLTMTTNLVELMALCCIGLNPSTLDHAQVLLPLPGILDILACTDKPLKLKDQMAFIMFLREAWFNSGINRSEGHAGPSEYGGTWWVMNEQWWNVVSCFHNIMRDFLHHRLDAALGEQVDYADFIFHGVLVCLDHFCQCSWTGETLGSEHARQVLNDIISDACKLLSSTETMECVTTSHVLELENFLKRMKSVDLYGTGHGEIWMKNQIQRCQKRRQDQPAAVVSKESSRSFVAFVAQELAALAREHHDDVAVDDLPFFSATLYRYTYTKSHGKAGQILERLIHHMRSGHLTDAVQISLLQAFTHVIHGTREECEEEPEATPWLPWPLSSISEQFPQASKAMEDRTTLAQMQIRFDSADATALMTELVTDSCWPVVCEAMQFGIALLWGGNSAVQESLLQVLRDGSSAFCQSTARYLQEMVAAIREHRRGAAFLDMREDFVIDAAALKEWHSAAESQKARQLEALMRLLQLFCEGHHLRLQNYVRHQEDNLQSFNLVNEVLLFLREAVLFRMDNVLMKMAIQAFSTLTEFCQGPCPQNQATLVAYNINQQVNNVLESEYPECDLSLQFELRSAAVTTLLSLLEGCNDQQRFSLMIRTLSFAAMRSTLDAIWDQVKHWVNDMEHPTKAQEETLDLGFNLFILMYILHSRDREGNDELENSLKGCAGYDCFCAMLGVIEIARDNRVERVYFRKPTLASSLRLSKHLKASLMANIDRSSPVAKVADFFEKSSELILEIEYTHQLQGHLQKLDIVPEAWITTERSQRMATITNRLVREFLRQLVSRGTAVLEARVFRTAVALNLLLFASYEPDLTWQVTLALQLGINLFGLYILVSTLLVCMHALFFQVPVILYKQQLGASRQPQTKWSVVTAIRFVRDLDGTTRLNFAFYLAIVTAALLGLFVSHIWFCFHLLLVIRNNPLLQNVISSVTRNGKSLLLTATLMMIIIYLFTVIGFHLFPEDFVDEEGIRYCESLSQCLAFTLSHGIRTGGGVAELMSFRRYGEPHYAARLLWDTLFYIIVVVILLNNSVFGIIMDTFAELRDVRSRIEADAMDRCFICGIHAYTFDRYVEGGFSHHIQKAHNVWQYLYFMHHLRRKPEDEYTGQESYVAGKIARKDVSFFPVNRSLDLQNLDIDPFEHQGRTSRSRRGHDDDGGDVPEQGIVNSALQQRIHAMEQSIGALEKTSQALLDTAEKQLQQARDTDLVVQDASENVEEVIGSCNELDRQVKSLETKMKDLDTKVVRMAFILDRMERYMGKEQQQQQQAPLSHRERATHPHVYSPSQTPGTPLRSKADSSEKGRRSA